jgi:hypothetical protein
MNPRSGFTRNASQDSVAQGRSVKDVRIIRDAAAEGIAAGLRDHLPGGVGILVKGCAIGSVAALCHIVLGVDVTPTVIGGLLSGAGMAALQRWPRTR